MENDSTTDARPDPVPRLADLTMHQARRLSRKKLDQAYREATRLEILNYETRVHSADLNMLAVVVFGGIVLGIVAIIFLGP